MDKKAKHRRGAGGESSGHAQSVAVYQELQQHHYQNSLDIILGAEAEPEKQQRPLVSVNNREWKSYKL